MKFLIKLARNVTFIHFYKIAELATIIHHAYLARMILYYILFLKLKKINKKCLLKKFL